jgi:hypothetical protein
VVSLGSFGYIQPSILGILDTGSQNGHIEVEPRGVTEVTQGPVGPFGVPGEERLQLSMMAACGGRWNRPHTHSAAPVLKFQDASRTTDHLGPPRPMDSGMQRRFTPPRPRVGHQAAPRRVPKWCQAAGLRGGGPTSPHRDSRQRFAEGLHPARDGRCSSRTARPELPSHAGSTPRRLGLNRAAGARNGRYLTPDCGTTSRVSGASRRYPRRPSPIPVRP